MNGRQQPWQTVFPSSAFDASVRNLLPSATLSAHCTSELAIQLMTVDICIWKAILDRVLEGSPYLRFEVIDYRFHSYLCHRCLLGRLYAIGAV